MRQEDHEAKALATFGRECTFVHEFLDQYFSAYGPYHRIVLHHQRGIELIKTAFPNEDPDLIEKVAIQHIRDDLHGSMPHDWWEFDTTIEYLDHVISKKCKRPPGRLLERMKKLYPEDFNARKRPWTVQGKTMYYIRKADLADPEREAFQKFLVATCRNAPVPPGEIPGSTAWWHDYQAFARGEDPYLGIKAMSGFPKED
ncbi:MAG: hypothetical protein HUN04_05995 [Desulfobacter sp.]|nr:MAG: hypothetical protein HUN04_05995 [Desulfobacter sp.]